MANSFGAIELGKRSLMAHTQQITTAGHNISNADTEGYTRQRVQVKTFDPMTLSVQKLRDKLDRVLQSNRLPVFVMNSWISVLWHRKIRNHTGQPVKNIM